MGPRWDRAAQGRTSRGSQGGLGKVNCGGCAQLGHPSSLPKPSPPKVGGRPDHRSHPSPGATRPRGPQFSASRAYGVSHLEGGTGGPHAPESRSPAPGAGSSLAPCPQSAGGATEQQREPVSPFIACRPRRPRRGEGVHGSLREADHTRVRPTAQAPARPNPWPRRGRG